MTEPVIRPLAAGEETLFESMPDPFPALRQIGYRDGLASGGYRPERTWVAIEGDRVVARAAWVRPPGAVGRAWLERFDLVTAPEVGAALLNAAHAALGGPTVYYATVPPGWRQDPEASAVAGPLMAAARLAGLAERGERVRMSWTPASTPTPTPADRFTVRRAADAAEINALVGRIGTPDVVTGKETARAVGGVDLATDPLAWLGAGTPGAWLIAEEAGRPVGLAGTAGDACYPLIAYLGLLDRAARAGLLAEAVRLLATGGAEEVVADVDADRPAVVAALERTGFRPARVRVVFEPG